MSLETLVAMLTDIALNGSLILSAAWLVARLWRRGTAAARYRIWLVGLSAVLLLPIARAGLPRWDLPVLPSRAMAASTLTVGRRPDRSAPRDAVAPSAVATTTAPAPMSSRDAAAVVAIWLLGVLVALVRLAVGTVRMARRARDAELVADPMLPSDVQRLARGQGIRRPITVLQARQECVPVTWGIVYPVLLLPPSAAQWSAERRRVVLQHEVAHIARVDSFTQLLAQVAAALAWFHPLAWLAVRRANEERERACDDLVLANGTPAPDYASELLALARAVSRADAPAFAALPVAGPSFFDARVRAILDTAMRRERAPRGWTVGASAGLLLAVPVALLHPVRRVVAAVPSSSETLAPRAEPVRLRQGDTVEIRSFIRGAASHLRLRTVATGADDAGGVGVAADAPPPEADVPLRWTVPPGHAVVVTTRNAADTLDIRTRRPTTGTQRQYITVGTVRLTADVGGGIRVRGSDMLVRDLP